MQPWRVLDLIRTSTEYLEHHGVPDPRLDAEYLLAHVLRVKRLDLYLQHDRPLQKEELDPYRELIRQRGQRIPLQHLTGNTEFMGLSLMCNPDALIPRPETEVLVETILERNGGGNLQVLDIGTGSGCIALALAHARPEWQITAVDVSEPALRLARGNTTNLGVANIRFTKLDILVERPPGAPFDLIVSNPPYIAEKETDTLQEEVREHDPGLALFAADQGMQFYERFAAIFHEVLGAGSRFYLEFGGKDQARALLDLFAGYDSLETVTDLEGHPRVLCGKNRA